jgi:MFS family permease
VTPRANGKIQAVNQTEPLESAAPARGLFTRGLRWLLQMDKPIPRLTPDELAAQAERDYPWNFAVNVADGAFFLFGAAFIASSTILPLFLSKLTTNPLAFGLLAVIAQSGWFLPQLFTANWMERLSRKKPVVVNLGLFTERVPLLFFPFVALLAATAPVAAAVLLLLLYAWHSFGAGIVAVSWQDLIARCFPVDRRGRYAGTSAFLGAASGFGGSLLATWLLREYAFPLNFTLVFALGAAGISISWFFLALTREPVQEANAPRRSSAEYLRGLPELLAEDKNYLRFLVARMLMAVGGMAAGFITVSAVERYQVPDSTAGVYTLAMLGGQAAANLLFGYLSDRRGHKVCLEIGVLASLLAYLIAWLAPHPAFYYVVFALYGMTTGAVIISGILIVMEFSGPERRPTYMGVANTAVGIAAAVAPLIGAALASVGFSLLFAVAGAVTLASLLMFRFGVREPRHAPLTNRS